MPLKYVVRILCFPLYLVTTEMCGRVVNHKIIGGTPAQYPWYAAIAPKYSPSGTLKVFCGGSLITRKDVLTAAHCLVLWPNNKIAPENLAVHLGVRNACWGKGQGKKVLVSRTVTHPQYKPTQLWHDIGIIVLKNEVDFIPVCLPNPLSKLPSSAEVIGMGNTNAARYKASCTLKKAKLNVIKYTECQKFLRSFDNHITEDVICAGNLKEHKDSCNGDSGGPLQQINGNNSYTVFGIVSFGVGCDKLPHAVYTDVRKFITWIKKNVEYKNDI